MAKFSCENISDLPHELIVAIISLLPFIEAYRFCLLRKEWYAKALWLQCTCLELHDTDFYYTKARQHCLALGKRVRSMDLKELGRLRYVHFLDTTIKNLAAKEISKLSFRLPILTQHHKNIDTWITIAAKKCVKELSLDFSDGDTLEPQPMQLNQPYVLPNHLYQNAASIRVFSVSSCGLGFCNFSNFVSLKSLSLTRVRIFWAEVAHLVLSCPLLESLSLVECYRLLKVDICFNNRRLKTLVVKHCGSLNMGFELFMPTLEYFEYVGKPVQFVMRNVDALQEVLLDYRMNPYSRDYNVDDYRQLFDGFSRPRILKTSTTFLKVFVTDLLLLGQSLYRLMYTQHLLLTTCLEGYELPAILLLLRSSPLLKTLSIFSTGFTRLLPFQEIMHQTYPSLPRNIWTKEGWSFNLLEQVEIDGYVGKKNEIDFLKFIIRNSRSLQIVNLKPWVDSNMSSPSFSRGLQDIRAEAFLHGDAEINIV
ncbi:hypothetical protein ACOSQ2_002669 [Xanthoceras sorbifolium]|uniref:At1g61320/AtMIF1 LRR domain-containing protein n=1 Tax=Xanthoceras sorbifolium TaxID=99658 RepID=A0ABQ8IJU4_9ROSI|nr:hypothetical protein JRO89_XS01G0142200 [Xanthoceras sorbifolium]